MALVSNIVADVSATLTGARDMGSASAPLKKRVALALDSGTGANQADVVFADTRTLAPSATDTLDLNGGGLIDALGTAFAPVKLKAILVAASAANTNTVQVTRPGANGVPIFAAAGDAVTLPPGGVFLLACPAAVGIATVAAGTSDLLAVTNGGAGTSVDYDLVLIGTSA